MYIFNPFSFSKTDFNTSREKCGKSGQCCQFLSSLIVSLYAPTSRYNLFPRKMMRKQTSHMVCTLLINLKQNDEELETHCTNLSILCATLVYRSFTMNSVIVQMYTYAPMA